MRLRVLTNLTGPDFALVAGDITDRFDAVAAKKLIAYRNAEIVPDDETPSERRKKSAPDAITETPEQEAF
jgi:hypothetical protein